MKRVGSSDLPGRVGNIGPVGYAKWEHGLGVAGSFRFSSKSLGRYQSEKQISC